MESSIDVNQTEMSEYLKKQQKRRAHAIEAFKPFLDEMLTKKKRIRYRKWLYSMIMQAGNTVFETEEDEYQFIGKFYRGIWCDVGVTFTEEDLTSLAQFASAFGAMDY